MKRIVCVDLDGTLIDDRTEELRPFAVDALRQLKRTSTIIIWSLSDEQRLIRIVTRHKIPNDGYLSRSQMKDGRRVVKNVRNEFGDEAVLIDDQASLAPCKSQSIIVTPYDGRNKDSDETWVKLYLTLQREGPLPLQGILFRGACMNLLRFDSGRWIVDP